MAEVCEGALQPIGERVRTDRRTLIDEANRGLLA